MNVDLAMLKGGLARSRAEAQRLVKQGAVSVGGCTDGCTFFNTGNCTCNGWVKVQKPNYNVCNGWCIKVRNGFYRTVKRVDGRQGVDILKGVCRVREEVTV